VSTYKKDNPRRKGKFPLAYNERNLVGRHGHILVSGYWSDSPRNWFPGCHSISWPFLLRLSYLNEYSLYTIFKHLIEPKCGEKFQIFLVYFLLLKQVNQNIIHYIYCRLESTHPPLPPTFWTMYGMGVQD
jgi:hypothetical protein